MRLNWRIFLHIHIYLGLFSLPYLLIFALSSLNFNHHFISEKPLSEWREWKAQVDIAASDDLLQVADQLMDALSIFGWFIPYESYRDAEKTFIVIVQPGKIYHITLQPDGSALVKERLQSGAHILKSLHGLGENIPHAPWIVNTWKYYQSLTVYAVLFWIVTGVYFWSRNRRRPVLEKRLIWVFSIFSALLILFIWLRK